MADRPITEFEPGNEVATACFERLIRADERRRVMAEIESFAQQYIERWAKIIGEDRAKATAFDLVSIAHSLGGNHGT